MKKIILAILLLNSIAGFSQHYLAMAKTAGKWGYIDESGKFVIQPRSGAFTSFSTNGVAAILLTDHTQYEFIRSNGSPFPVKIKNFTLLFDGSDAIGYSDGMVAVEIDAKWGFLDNDGNLFIKAIYNEVTEFDAGYAIGKITNAGGNNFYVILKTGSVLPIENDNIKTIKHFTEGMAPYFTTDKRAGFVDINGKTVIKAQFKSVGYFSNGLAWAKTNKGKVGYIDKTGGWVIEPKFDVAKNFDPTSGMASVKIGKQWSYVNAKGESLNISLDRYGQFSEGLCWGSQDGERIGFFDAKGNWVVTPQFEVVHNFKNGHAVVRQSGKWGIINKEGKWVVQPSFDGLRDMELVP